MFYYLALWLVPHFNAFNVLTYYTVRAGGAAFTGFFISLIIGPSVIRWLRRLKFGQYIREEHVENLHALHKGKAGTPTMGGMLIIIATLITLALWARPFDRLLLIAVVVFCFLGGVGFLDDYIKIRRKHNKGLSARAKFAGQIICGLALGVYLYLDPIAFGPSILIRDDVKDWPELTQRLREQDVQAALAEAAPGLTDATGTVPDDSEAQAALLNSLNEAIQSPSLLTAAWPGGNAMPPEAESLRQKPSTALNRAELMRHNRLYMEALLGPTLTVSKNHLHTKVEIPFFKFMFVPLGIFYILFVLMIIVSSSNSVNLTDGLDGLAIGASVISLIAFTLIAYIVSRADWSEYLLLINVPGASELTVFGAALIGTGLGFLWFNSHPAEVFMGDTGSLALGGALGTMAILTKQELLLIVVGGLFVIEAGSVLIQVASFKLRKKRVFKMAPLHHHFELLGWSESKVTIRFWIMAILFALLSLSTLKLR